MRKIIYFAALCLVCLGLTSCNDWLDVQQDNEQKEEDIFKKETGFRNALTNCYMDLADRDAYGENLTMTSIECLGNLWQLPNPETSSYNEDYKAAYYLRTYQYDVDDSKDVIEAIYGKLFNVITQANMVINHAKANKNVFNSEKNYSIILGEAYALHALCQMDVLRLFGQLPQNATKQVSLPYSETATLDVMPPYYNFSDYVAKLKSDLSEAERLLKDNDPVYGTTFNKASDEDDYFEYRQFRLNYWAVKALQARLYLYLGETEAAHSTAMEIINAAPLTLSGTTDLIATNMFLTCPSEALFMLSKYDLIDYTVTLFSDDNNAQVSFFGGLYDLTMDQFNELYKGVQTSSHNRYIREWNKNKYDGQKTSYVTLRKYWYDSTNPTSGQSSSLMTKVQVIPMIRLSEIYLIAIETSNDLSEVNSLYQTYMRSHEVLLTEDAFSTLEAAREEVVNEYRREFFGEGLMFYVYKRKGATTQMFNSNTVTEDNYIVPLPTSEYDPSAVK